MDNDDDEKSLFCIAKAIQSKEHSLRVLKVTENANDSAAIKAIASIACTSQLVHLQTRNVLSIHPQSLQHNLSLQVLLPCFSRDIQRVLSRNMTLRDNVRHCALLLIMAKLNNDGNRLIHMLNIGVIVEIGKYVYATRNDVEWIRLSKE